MNKMETEKSMTSRTTSDRPTHYRLENTVLYETFNYLNIRRYTGG